MEWEQVKKVLASEGLHVRDTKVDGYYKVNGCGKYRSERSLMRQAKSIVKQQKKAARQTALRLSINDSLRKIGKARRVKS